jgi:hypothetical protein
VNTNRSNFVRRSRWPKICPLQINQPRSNYAVFRRDSSLAVAYQLMYIIILALQPQSVMGDTRTHTHILFSALETSLFTATVLASLEARTGNLSNTIEKLYITLLPCTV